MAFLSHFAALLLGLPLHAVVVTASSRVLARSTAVSEASFRLHDRAQRLAIALGRELSKHHRGSASKGLQVPEDALITRVVELPVLPALVHAARERLAEESDRLEANEQQTRTKLEDADVLEAFRDYARRAPPMVLIMPEGDEQSVMIPDQKAHEENSILRSASHVSANGAPREGRMLRREDVPDVAAETVVFQTHPSFGLSPSRHPTELSSLTLGPVAVMVEAQSNKTEEHSEAGIDRRTDGQDQRANEFIAQAVNHEVPNGNIQIAQNSEITEDTANSVAKSVERMVEEMHNIQQKLGPGALQDILGEILLEKRRADETHSKNDGDKEIHRPSLARHPQAVGEVASSSEIVVDGGSMAGWKRRCQNENCDTWVISKESTKAPAIDIDGDDELPRSGSAWLPAPPAEAVPVHSFIKLPA